MIERHLVEDMARLALAEDLGTGDVTAELIPSATIATARIVCREAGVVCGIAWVNAVFSQLDPRIRIDWRVADGSHIDTNAVLCELTGNARALISGERVALNFLQTLSGTATRTRTYVERVSHTKARILDTRKTLPGFRRAQKYAVLQGGGSNHRLGLFDALLIKENHIAAAGSLTSAVTRARLAHPELRLEVEVETPAELEEALIQQPDQILLDNFDVAGIAQAVHTRDAYTVDRPVLLEASGGVSLATITAIAETGVDFISVGDLTKNVTALDLSMRFMDRR